MRAFWWGFLGMGMVAAIVLVLIDRYLRRPTALKRYRCA